MTEALQARPATSITRRGFLGTLGKAALCVAGAAAAGAVGKAAGVVNAVSGGIVRGMTLPDGTRVEFGDWITDKPVWSTIADESEKLRETMAFVSEFLYDTARKPQP